MHSRSLAYFAVLVHVIFCLKEVLSLWSGSSSVGISRSSLRNYFTSRNAAILSIRMTVDSADTVRDKDEHYMRLALRHAQHSFREKEVPIGAIIVDKDGTILATSRNQVEAKNDVTAHAEISCIRKVAQMKKNWRLSECTLYSTLEPCPMCMGAIQASRIKKLVYGAPDLRMGACGSWVNLVDAKHPFHDVEVVGGLLHQESSTLLKRFFQMRRREAASQKLIDAGKIDVSANGNEGVIAENTVELEGSSSSSSGEVELATDDNDPADTATDSNFVRELEGVATSDSHIDRGYHFNDLLDIDIQN